MSASDKLWADNQPPQCDAADLNGFKNENSLLILGSSQALSTADNQQTHKAVASYAAAGQFFTGGGIADAYTLSAPAPRVAPPALQDGMLFRALFPAPNTGAATVNPFGIGLVDIKLAGGVVDPLAGDISTNEVVLKYRTSPGVHFELINSGQVKITVVTVSDAAWIPSPGVKTIEFVEVIGAGGGGGGVDGQGAGTNAAGAGGAAGSPARLVTQTIDASYNIVIGAGGVGGVGTGGASGSTGGDTTITSASVNIVTKGGPGGAGMVGNAGSPASSNGGVGLLSTGGDQNYRGSDGSSGIVKNGDAVAIGDSAPSILGGGKRGKATSAGAPGGAPGAGGSGAGVGAVTTDFPGGDGADGVVIIKEYF